MMSPLCLASAILFSFLYLASSNPIQEPKGPEGNAQPLGGGDMVGLSDQTDLDSTDADKRNWNNLQNMWGKRGWNNLQGMWGKRSNWNNLNQMWGKRSNWNNLQNMWGKRDWNDLQGMWGKRGWNNLNNMWGKRTNWNNLSHMWGKRSGDKDDGSKRTTQWNNLKGLWGKRSDGDWAQEALLERLSPDEIENLRGLYLSEEK